MIVTAFIEFKNKSTSTQVIVKKITEAIPVLIESGIINEFCSSVEPGKAVKFKKADMILFTAMDCLTNMWLCQIGRAGLYASIILTVTVTDKIKI